MLFKVGDINTKKGKQDRLNWILGNKCFKISFPKVNKRYEEYGLSKNPKKYNFP
jgi:hypothetical protein